MNQQQRHTLIREAIEKGVPLHRIESYLDECENLLRREALETEKAALRPSPIPPPHISSPEAT